MNKKIASLRSPLGQVRGLGSARHGTGHWWTQRLTAIALIPLTWWVLSDFLNNVVFGTYASTLTWLHSPLSGGVVILLLAVGFHHAASGLQVIIEDYIHCECAKLTSVIAVKFLSTCFALLGILATLKVMFGV